MAKNKDTDTQMCFWLSKESKNWIYAEAYKRGVSASALLREIVGNYIKVAWQGDRCQP